MSIDCFLIAEFRQCVSQGNLKIELG